MSSDHWSKIAKIDGKCACKTPGLRDITCQKCGKFHRPDYDDDGVMFGVLIRWAQNSGFESDDASERWYDYHYDGHMHKINCERRTRVFDDSVGQGNSFTGEAKDPDFAIAAQKALIQVEEA